MQVLRRILLSHDVFPWVLIVGMVSLFVVTLVAVVAEEEESLDLNSGMTRWRINVGRLPLISRKHETYVSRLVGPRSGRPVWRTMRTWSLRYALSSQCGTPEALYVLKDIEIGASVFGPPEEETRQLAEEVLICLQRNDTKIAAEKVQAWFDQLRLAAGKVP